MLSSEKTQRECFGAKDGSVDPVGALDAEHRIVAPKFQQVLMQRHDVRICFALGMLQLALLVCRPLMRFSHGELGSRIRDTPKLSDKLGASFCDQRSQIFVVIREVQERTRGAEFLALKQHRCAGA